MKSSSCFRFGFRCFVFFFGSWNGLLIFFRGFRVFSFRLGYSNFFRGSCLDFSNHLDAEGDPDFGMNTQGEFVAANVSDWSMERNRLAFEIVSLILQQLEDFPAGD